MHRIFGICILLWTGRRGKPLLEKTSKERGLLGELKAFLYRFQNRVRVFYQKAAKMADGVFPLEKFEGFSSEGLRTY